MTKTHKKQHTIPRSYLASWLEPVTPPGQTPAIHLISKEDQSVRRKASVKTFTETDRYTVRLKNGKGLSITRHSRVTHNEGIDYGPGEWVFGARI
jgi:hypothetical protein